MALFRNPRLTDHILTLLACAHKFFEEAKWNPRPGVYPNREMEIQVVLVLQCLTTRGNLEDTAKIIVKGLSAVAEKKDLDAKETVNKAKKACDLLDNLYRFNQGIHIQFKELLPQEIIQRLDQGEKMETCMLSLCRLTQNQASHSPPIQEFNRIQLGRGKGGN